MKLHAFLAVVSALLIGACKSADAGGEEWEVLFDGSSTDNWRGYKKEAMPAGWEVQEGALVRTDAGGDIVTKEQYGDFVLMLEWKVASGANSGIFFRGTEERNYVWESAPEYQILDNAVHRDGGDPRTSAGANYALHAPPEDYTRPVGEWNEAKLEVKGAHVRHWLNGHLIVEYDLWSDEWKQLVADSKFGTMPDYGMAKRGHIALQDHGDMVAYRNIKIRVLE